MSTDPIGKWSVTIGGHKTSVSLERGFWDALKPVAAARGQTVSQLIAAVDDARDHANLSSALRILVLSHYREAARRGATTNLSPGTEPATPGADTAGAPAGDS